jgi:hypothetical protein
VGYGHITTSPQDCVETERTCGAWWTCAERKETRDSAEWEEKYETMRQFSRNYHGGPMGFNHADLPEVGRESPNGSGQPSLLDEEFLGDTSGTLLQINNKLWHLK